MELSSDREENAVEPAARVTCGGGSSPGSTPSTAAAGTRGSTLACSTLPPVLPGIPLVAVGPALERQCSVIKQRRDKACLKEVPFVMLDSNGHGIGH